MRLKHRAKFPNKGKLGLRHTAELFPTVKGKRMRRESRREPSGWQTTVLRELQPLKTETKPAMEQDKEQHTKPSSLSLY